jgi:hypothetical protein
MNSTSLNLIAVTVFLLTLSSLLGPLIHLSPLVPAIATAGAIAGLAIDALGLQGQGSTILFDWIDLNFGEKSSERQLRVACHEAGHFLVAYLYDIEIADYTLTAWESWRKGYKGRGGVQFDDRLLAAQVGKNQISAQLLDRYCHVWMAGIAAETLTFGNASGGGDDRTQLQAILARLQPPIRDPAIRERQAILQAKTLLQNHRSAYEALVDAMQSRCSIAECYQTIARHQERVDR